MDQQKDEDIFPQSFFCPLTLQVMEDPVMDREGNSYERTAIEEWLKKNATSPVTRNPITLEDAIEEKRSQLGNPKPKPKKEAPKDPVPEVSKDKADVTMDITASKTWVDADEALVMVSLQPPVSKIPTPCDICCVVDVSGSMGTEAKVQGNNEAHGLSLLDIVKHAVKTIINVLDKSDRLSIVSYSTKAKVVLDLTSMDSSGKAKALKELDKLDTEDQTNLWDGLHQGLEVIRKGSSKQGRLSAVLLLTDGQPNVVPPRGHVPMLQKYKDDYHLSCTINTFGFGYNLDSELLKDLAIEGAGSYSFIPDSGFVGTVFVNTISNLLSTYAKNVQISLEPLNGAVIEEGSVLGGYPTKYTSWGASVNLSSIQFEQTKNLVVKVKRGKEASQDQPYISVTLTYETAHSAKPIEVKMEGTKWSTTLEIEAQRHRLVAVDFIRQGMQTMKMDHHNQLIPDLKALIKAIKDSPSAKSDKRVQGLVKDLEGQVLEAFSRIEYYTKWGQHYLPSLVNAHLLQICNNFKDPGVQVYGGKLFTQLRDKADEIFVKLPPPKPKPSPYASSSHKFSSSSSSSYSAPHSMSTYHSSANPCFHGDCVVSMADGTIKKVKNIVKGDKVLCPGGKHAEVLCVLRTECNEGIADLVQLEGNLLITAYHPVRVNGKWCFPCSLAPVTQLPCDMVYSFLLKEQHVMIINGMECVALGHNFQEEVVQHPYFGSQLIVEDLKKLHGWNEGTVRLKSGCLVRNNSTGLVCALQQHSS